MSTLSAARDYTGAASSADAGPVQQRSWEAVAGLRVAVIIPTWNAEKDWPAFDDALQRQGIAHDAVLILDSSSRDRTRLLAAASGYRVLTISQDDFNHGGTRQLGCEQFPDAEAFVLLTQDALLQAPDSLEVLVSALHDPHVGAAYGRQLARVQAGAIERHGRVFNYPNQSRVRSLQDRQSLGIRAASMSNSFAVYRRTALEQVGGFPTDVIHGEDSYVAAKMLMNGWKIAYVSEAAVIHSHGFTVREEFARYFDTGVSHRRSGWLIETFGKPTGEGIRFVRSEMRHLARHAPALIPEAMLRVLSKIVAYRLGLLHEHLPKRWNRRLSNCKSFWNAAER